VYQPAAFVETDIDVLVQGIRSWPLGTVIEQTAGGLDANHIPLVLQPHAQAGRWVLQGHVPRANPLADDAVDGKPVLVIFHGPSAYITPAWYPAKKVHGRVVPTYNYQVIHVHGHMRRVDDPVWIRRQIDALTLQMEQSRETPWSADDAPAEYIDSMIGRLKGIEISVDRLIGKTKASQNQPVENAAGVLAGLQAAGLAAAEPLARLLEVRRPDDGSSIR
jgi:transcriptional regulator